MGHLVNVMDFRFNVGDSVWKPTWPQQGGTVVRRGYVGWNWPSYIVERPDGVQVVILEDDAQRVAGETGYSIRHGGDSE